MSSAKVDESSYHDENEEDYKQLTEAAKERALSSRNPWFNEFWEHRFGCSLSLSPSCAQHQLNESNWDSKLQFIVDATYVFAQALHVYFNCTSSMCFNVSFKNINGTKLFQIILETTFSSKFQDRTFSSPTRLFQCLTFDKFNSTPNASFLVTTESITIVDPISRRSIARRRRTSMFPWASGKSVEIKREY